MSKYFVTGCTGFVAGHLIPKLQTLNHEVVTDYRYFNDSYDAIVHLAAVTHIRPEFDPKLIEANYILTNEVFKKNCRIVYASSCSAAHDTNPYAQTKMWAEHLGKKHGNAIGLRFHNIYGLNNNKGIVWWLMQQPTNSKITIRGTELIRDYIHIDDVVNYILSVSWADKNMEEIWGEEFMQHSGDNHSKVIDVGTGVGTTTLELVQLYRKLSGKRFELEFAAAGENEPGKMVSNNIVPHMSLEEGLEKMIE